MVYVQSSYYLYTQSLKSVGGGGECMLILFGKHVLYIKVAYAMKHVHTNVR